MRSSSTVPRPGGPGPSALRGTSCSAVLAKMSATLAFKENFDSEKAKGALEDILAAFDQPENFARLQDAKDLAGNDMLKHMQIVFPLLTQIEMTVIESYGFTRDGEGVLQFAQIIKQMEREHPEIARLNAELRAHFIPPMVPPSLPDN